MLTCQAIFVLQVPLVPGTGMRIPVVYLVPGTRYQGTSQEWYLVPDCHVLLTGNIPVDSKYGVVSVHAAYSAQMEQNRGT